MHFQNWDGDRDDPEAFLNTVEKTAGSLVVQGSVGINTYTMSDCLRMGTLPLKKTDCEGQVSYILNDLLPAVVWHCEKERAIPRAISQKIKTDGLPWLKPAVPTITEMTELVLLEQFAAVLPPEECN